MSWMVRRFVQVKMRVCRFRVQSCNKQASHQLHRYIQEVSANCRLIDFKSDVRFHLSQLTEVLGVINEVLQCVGSVCPYKEGEETHF